MECGAYLDVLVAMKVLSTPDIHNGKAFLVEIVAMLTALAKSVAGQRVREERQDYLLHKQT